MASVEKQLNGISFISFRQRRVQKEAKESKGYPVDQQEHPNPGSPHRKKKRVCTTFELHVLQLNGVEWYDGIECGECVVVS